MARFGDEAGIFWTDPVKERTGRFQGERPVPPTPDTGWVMPTEFPDLSGQGMLSVDVETYDPDLLDKGPGSFRGGYIAGISIGSEAGFREYFPVAHKGYQNCDRNQVFDWASEQLSRPGQPKVGANLIYDLEYLTQEGVEVDGPFYDVQIAEPLINENRLSYSLESLSQAYLGEGKDQDVMYQWLIDAFGKTNVKGNIYRAPPAVVGPYAISDIDLPLRIFRKQKKLLEADSLWDVFILESTLMPILLQMRLRGIRVDLSAAERLRDKMNLDRDAILKKIKHITGVEVDMWSAESLARVYDAAGVRYPLTAKTKKPSFTKEWLENNDHPMSQMIKEARHTEKFATTFLEGYIINGNVKERLHTNFRQLKSDDGGTVTGRLSSSGPNLQNIPVRTADGQLIREMFVADMDQLLYTIDFSQVEYRIFGHFAYISKQPGAEELVRIYSEDYEADFHGVLAAATGLTRDEAKTLNFGLLYGQGIDLLCENLHVSREEGMQIINDYHRRAPYAKPFLQMVAKLANDRGWIKTLLGRRRRFETWEKYGKNGFKEFRDDYAPGFKRAFTHKAVNSLVQGSAADVMKKAMVEVYHSGVMDVIGIPSLTVHDELVGSFPDTKLGWEAIREMKNTMENCVKLSVPLLAELKTGLNWGVAKKNKS